MTKQEILIALEVLTEISSEVYIRDVANVLRDRFDSLDNDSQVYPTDQNGLIWNN